MIGTANPSVGRVNSERIIKYTQGKSLFSVVSVANPSVKRDPITHKRTHGGKTTSDKRFPSHINMTSVIKLHHKMGGGSRSVVGLSPTNSCEYVHKYVGCKDSAAMPITTQLAGVRNSQVRSRQARGPFWLRIPPQISPE